MIVNLIFFKYFLESVFPLLPWRRYIFICFVVASCILDVIVASIWSYIIL